MILSKTIYLKTFKFTSRVLSSNLTKLFARYFNKATTSIQIATEWFIKDTIHDNRAAQPTTVWDADGTAELEITEADYPTVDFDKVVFSGVTTDNTGVFLSHTRSGGICTVESSAQNLANIKMWDVDELELGSELVVNGDFATDSDWTKYGDTEINSGSGRIYSSDGSYSGLAETILPTGEVVIEFDVISTDVVGLGIKCEDNISPSFNTSSIGHQKRVAVSTGGLFRIGRASGITDIRIDNVSVKQIQLSQSDITDLNLKGTQVGVLAQFSMEEGAGTGTTDNVIVFDRLNDGVYATIVSNVSGSTWSTDSTIESINNAVGYSVSDETAFGDELVVNGDFSDGTNGFTPDKNAVLSAVNQQLHIDNGGTDYARTRSDISLTVGEKYITSVDCINNGTNGSSFYALSLRPFGTISMESGNTYTESFIADSGYTPFYENNGAGTGLIIDNVSVRNALEQSVHIPISATNKSLTVLGTTPTYTGVAGYHAKMVEQNCVETTNTEYIQLSENVIDGNKWAFEIDLDDVDVTAQWNSLFRSSSATHSTIGLNNNYSNIIRVRNRTGGITSGTYDSSNIINGKLLFISNTITVKVYLNAVLIDTLTIDADCEFNQLLAQTGGFGYKGKANNAKIWDLTAYTSGEIDALDFTTLAPTNWFALNEYDNELTLPSTLTFYDKMGTGVTGVLTNGSDANISKADGMSSNFEKGFNTAVVSDGVDDYIDTGVVPTDSTNVEIVGSVNSIADNYGLISINDGSNRYHSRNISGHWQFGYGNVSIQGGSSDTDIHKFNLIAGDGMYIDDVKIIDVSSNTFASSVLPLRLFQSYGNISSPCTIVYAKIWDNGTLVRNFIPQQNGTLLDTVNDVIYTNQGTGSLGVVSIPSSEIDPTKDISGVDLLNKPSDKSSYTNSEQKVKYPEVAEFINREDYFLGEEQVVNGGFDTDTDWVKGIGWTIGSGKAVSDGSANNDLRYETTFNPSILKIKFDVSDLTQGSVRLFVNKPTFTQLISADSNGSYEATVEVTSGANNLYFYSTNNFIGSIDNVSVKEYFPLHTTGTANDIPLNKIDGGSENVTVNKTDGVINDIKFKK